MSFPSAANGQPKPLSHYLREEWGSENGFPGGPINDIAQTPDGYLWIGTQKGLVRFDGWNFRLLAQRIPNNDPIGPVLGLLADGEGSLWVRLEGPGLLRYREGKFEDYTNTLDLPEVAITQMCRATDGRAIFSTIFNGVIAYDRKFTSLARRPDLSNFIVTSMALDSDGGYWLGTRDRGLYHLREGKISARRDVLTEPQINALLSIGSKQLWIGTNKGVWLWNGDKLVRIGPDSSLRDRQILSLSKDGDGNVWVGTDRGLYRLDAESNFSPKTENTQGDGPVTAMLTDREENIWIATPRGLERLRNPIFTTYGASDGLPGESNGPVHVDPDGRTWFAPIQGGLYWLKGRQVGLIREGGLDKDVVYSVAGGNGDLWVARQSGGLTHLQKTATGWRAVNYTKADGLAQNTVYTVRLSRDGAVWAGTLNAGLTRFKNGKFTTFTVENGLISNTIAQILEGRDGTMWFATPQGLSAFSNNHWLSYSSKDGLPSDDVDCLFEDSLGTLWIGTMNGLAAVHSGKIWFPAQGADLLREPIFGIQVDARGFLWLSTSNHVVTINREKLLRSDFDGADLRQFTLADGLRTTDGVKRDEAVVSDNLGRIWFSLNRGLSVVDTNRLRIDSPPSILHLEGVFVDGNPISLQNPARIPPNPQRITIDYAGVSLSVPNRVRFKYKLDGFDKTWSDVVIAREANYTNLNPGSYVFRVVASNSDGLWNSTELEVPFTIEPVFWRTWWFQTTCVTLILFSVWCAYRYRMRRLADQFNMRLEERIGERTRIARELHDTLLQSFQGLLLLLRAASIVFPRSPEEAKQRLDKAIDQAEHAIKEGRDAVQGLRSSAIRINDLAESLATLGKELASAEANENPPAFHVKVEGTPQQLHPILRDEVQRIAGEALRNAFRHAHARHIEVEIRYDQRQLRLRIRDDGRGIESQVLEGQTRAGHWGLHGMRERACRIGAQLEIWSRPGTGTEVELRIPSATAYGFRRARAKWFWFQRPSDIDP